MSIETIATHINFYEDPEANRPELIENEPAERMETPVERRLRLHHEMAALIPELHELQARHHMLSTGILEMARKPTPSPKKARTKMTERKRMALQRKHRELMHTRRTLMQEQGNLAKEIHDKRTHQGKLIADMALSNTQIWRPPYDDGEFEQTRQTNKQVRANLESPVVEVVYNGGEDPRDLTTPSHDGEPHGPHYRYIKNAAL